MALNILLLSFLASYPILSSVVAADSDFTLYAYGTDINGLELFFADGNAQVGDISTAATSNVSNVYFTLDRGELLANPNLTSTRTFRPSFNSTWSNLELNVPVDDDSSNSISFTQNFISNETGKWRFYGPSLLFDTSSGQLISLFFAKPAATTGLFDLVWDLSKAEQEENPDAKPVALRNIAPTSG
ncbi:hypothetical protein UA08_05050 [Talaromyces atroroseus]|uniref:DOMON domain-containing protein n=1 Tax=Talaromyces atroroseus TaxID=1441469 RepID=A0A225AY30_TALAT|nr:hypothetical protein UA08_05050 [Talaromyces atroroseus]OKL59365.1 hypothetical protein UA08_05050 [Talaromyces atroroseus]